MIFIEKNMWYKCNNIRKEMIKSVNTMKLMVLNNMVKYGGYK